MRYMASYDLMETVRNTNQWLGASALAMASYPAFSMFPNPGLNWMAAWGEVTERTFSRIVVPQAIPRIVPAMGNYLVSIMKDVPVLSVVTVLEMLNVAKIIGDRTFNYLVPLSMVGGLYLILTLVAAQGVRRLDRALPKTGIPLK